MFFSITTYHFLTTDSKLAIVTASAFHFCLSSLSSCLSLRIIFVTIQKPCRGNFGKFQEFGESGFSGSEKDRYFLKILKWQHKLAWDYKRGKLAYYFLNNSGKTCLYGLKISENMELEHVSQPKAFFHFSRNLDTSCLSTFKENKDPKIFHKVKYHQIQLNSIIESNKKNSTPVYQISWQIQ